MLSQKIKQALPTLKELQEKYKLGFLGHYLLAPQIWHFHRHTVSRAVALGLFIGLLPLPGHMIIAAILAIMWSANLPIAVTIVWITNPITLVPISYLEYKVGLWLLQRPKGHFHLELTWKWFTKELESIWFPMMLGSLFLGIVLACLGFIMVRLLWRAWIVYQWRKRHKS